MTAVAQTIKTLSTFDRWIEDASRGSVAMLEDPFALAAASYREWLEGRGRWRSHELVEVTDQDRSQGRAMREYYRSRMVFERLKNINNQPISDFRQKLWGIIEGTYKITYNDLGLLYRLPYFYVEDQIHDRIFTELPTYTMIKQTAVDITESFELIAEVFVSRRARDTFQYWLRTDLTPVPCMISVASTDPLRSLLQSVLHRDEIKLLCNWHPQTMRGYHRGRQFYSLANIRLP